MAANMSVEEDPFSEFLQQEQSRQPVAYTHEVVAEQHPAPQDDATLQLRLLVDTAQRQEQLLGKVCSILVGLDEKLGSLAQTQERLEATMQRVVEQGGMQVGGVGKTVDPKANPLGSTRGALVLPPGKVGAAPSPGIGNSGVQSSASLSAEDQNLQAERLAAERLRIEEEARRRAEELARKKEDEERRRREEAERQRIEEERRKEQERQRKALLEKKNNRPHVRPYFWEQWWWPVRRG